MRAKEFMPEALETGYIAFELSAASRSALLAQFPPKYPDVIAHHITYAFGVKSDTPLPQASRIEVVGYTDDEAGLECLVVAVDGQRKRPDGKVFHITWSLDRSKGRKPVQSNDVIKDLGFASVGVAINISATPKFFGRG